jgi:cbb3-type cytochrome oxidase maturation protein
MEVIYGLIPAMIFLGLVMVGVLVWAVKSGQYDDLEGDANRILMDDDDPLLPGNEKQSEKGKRTLKDPETHKLAGRNWPDAD